MTSRVKFGPVERYGRINNRLVHAANPQYFAPLGAAFVRAVAGRLEVAPTAAPLLMGWSLQGFSEVSNDGRFDQATGQVIIPAGDPIKVLNDSGGSVYFVPTSQAFDADTHYGARASLDGVTAPVASGEVQTVDLADGAGTGIFRVLGCEVDGDTAAYVAITPAALQ